MKPELKGRSESIRQKMFFEFDSLDELRLFDTSYIADTRSSVLKEIAESFYGTEADISEIKPRKGRNTEAEGFVFRFRGEQYEYASGGRVSN